MTRKSKREIQRAVSDLSPDADCEGLEEIVIRDYVVPTSWSEESADTAEPELERARRMSRDGGEWTVEGLSEEDA